MVPACTCPLVYENNEGIITWQLSVASAVRKSGAFWQRKLWILSFRSLSSASGYHLNLVLESHQKPSAELHQGGLLWRTRSAGGACVSEVVGKPASALPPKWGIRLKKVAPRKELGRLLASFRKTSFCHFHGHLHLSEMPRHRSRCCAVPGETPPPPPKDFKAKQNRTMISMTASQKKKKWIYQLRCQFNFTSKQNISKVASGKHIVTQPLQSKREQRRGSWD